MFFQAVAKSYLVGRLSLKMVHFVIKAWNLVQLRPKAVQKKLDIGPLWILNMAAVMAI